MSTSSKPSSGWNRSGSTPKPVPKKPSAMRGIVAGLAVVALAVVCIVIFMGKGEKPVRKSDTKPARIKEVTPAAPKAQEGEKSGEKPAAKSAATVAQSYNEQVREFVKKSAGTNNIHWIVPPLAPDDPDRALHTRVTQELGSLLSVEPGEQMPPFPYSFLIEDDMKARGEDTRGVDNGNKGFLDALKKFKIVAKETDDEHRLDHKQKLIAAQSELLAGIDEGISVNDSIRAAYEFRKRAYEMRSTIINTLSELHEKDGDSEDTIRQINDMNNRLAEEGIKKIAIGEVIPDYEEPETEEVQK